MTPRMKRLVASAAVLASAATGTAVLAYGGMEGEAPSAVAISSLAEPGELGRRALAPIESYSATVARPLFSPTRQPELPPPAPVAAAAAPLPAPAAPVPPGTLLGILISPQGSAAILRLPGGRSETVSEGGSVEGWLVRQVSPDRVLLSSGATNAEVTFPVAQPPTAAAARPAGQAASPLRRRR